MRFLVLVFFFPVVEPHNFSVTNESEYQRSGENYLITWSEQPGCYNKFVGSRGSVQNLVVPNQYLPSMHCDWDIDVTRGFAVELEFEVFRLPINKKQHCDSYLEITYSPSQDEMVKRIVCPTDILNRISTGSQTVNIHFKSGAIAEESGNHTYGFKINYKAVAVNTSGGNHAVTVVLLSFATLIVISGVFCCFHHCYKFRKASNAPNNEGLSVQANAPNNEGLSVQANAPTRAELQSAFEFQRQVLQAPQIEKRYLSRTSSANSNVPSRKFFKNSTALCDLNPKVKEKKKISISTPPAGVRKLFSSESMRRIEHLRTRLVARFSSHSSSDISVFYEAPDRRSYTQLSCNDEQSPDEPPKEVLPKPDLKSKEIPSVVIEFVD